MGINNLGFGFKAQPNQAQAVQEGDKPQRGGACYAPNPQQVSQGIAHGTYKNGEIMTVELDDGTIITGKLVILERSEDGKSGKWYIDTSKNNKK